MILPEIFFAQMKKIFCAEEYEKFFLSFDDPPVRGLRINTLKIKNTHEIVEKICEKNFEKICEKNFVPWCNTGFIFSDERPAKSIAYHAGLFYIQEPSAMSPAEILGANPGHRVLDLCAAPGGKSVQIAGHLNGECVLVSNDASPSRCRALVKNLERAGITNAVVLAEQPKKLAERFREFFDRILVDAPCSGEGMFRRDADAVKAYTANKPEACAAVQKEILRQAARMLKSGGRMVYSTCTFNMIENEDVISAFLEKHDDFFLAETKRIFPHEKGEGHFVALLQKRGERERNENFQAKQTRNLDFEKFCGEFLDFEFPRGEFVAHGVNLYFQKTPLDLRGLRVARSGWFLGECSKGRFVPSQALAMGLRKEQAKFSAELSDADAKKYLRGESLHLEFENENTKPWILICHDGFPLGWARLVQGRLKNNLPVGWVNKE